MLNTLYTTPLHPLAENHTQVKISEYNALKSALSAATRKAGGSLAVRDINTVVKQDQVSVWLILACTFAHACT